MSDELEAIRKMNAKVEIIERKVDWIAAISVGGVTLVLLYYVHKIGAELFGEWGKLIVDIVAGTGVVFIPLVLSMWYNKYASRSTGAVGKR